MAAMTRIGILGGTFNPIHYGHLILADNACDQFQLDQVIFLPTGHAPHKEFMGEEMTRHRYELVKLAIKGNPAFTVSDYEMKNRQINYTYRSLDYFRGKYPDAQLYFIIGADSLFEFETWRHPEEICRKAIVLAAVRDDLTEHRVDEQIAYLRQKFHGQIYRVKTPNFNVSSAILRERISQGHTIRYLVPDAVADYISRNHLYLKDHTMTYEEMDARLKASLKPSRYRHTMGVVQTAEKLAKIYHYNVKKARTAALLHDCAKYMPDEQRIDYCQSHCVQVNDAERKNLSLLHAKCGAIMAREEYGVENREILHAIAVHTTGEPEMNLLDKILFVSDYIEPGRDRAPHLDELRSLAETDLDQTVAWILKDTLDYLKSQNGTVDEETRRAYEYYAGNIQKGVADQ